MTVQRPGIGGGRGEGDDGGEGGGRGGWESLPARTPSVLRSREGCLWRRANDLALLGRTKRYSGSEFPCDSEGGRSESVRDVSRTRECSSEFVSVSMPKFSEQSKQLNLDPKSRFLDSELEFENPNTT